MHRVSSPTSTPICDTARDDILGPCRLIEAKAAGKWSLSRLLRAFQSTPRTMVAHYAIQHGIGGPSYLQPNVSVLLFNLFHDASHSHVEVMPSRTAISTLAHLKPAAQFIFLFPAWILLFLRILVANVTSMGLSLYVCRVCSYNMRLSSFVYLKLPMSCLSIKPEFGLIVQL